LKKVTVSTAARVISEFANDKLVVKSIALGGQLLSASDIEQVAKLPTFSEAIWVVADDVFCQGGFATLSRSK